jgi:ADP-ribose pyrophosphatase
MAERREEPRTGDLSERIVGMRTIYRGHYLALQVAEIERADGSRAQREMVEHPGAVTVVALDDLDRVLLVRQWRVPAGRDLLELPAGTLDRDPASGGIEDPRLAAARELEEETGYRADRWELLGSFWTAPGFATERMYLYQAGNLRPADGEQLGPDPDERLELVHVPWRQAVEMAERGEIADAKSLVGLFWLARRRASSAAGTKPQPPAGPGGRASRPPGSRSNASR